MRWQLLYYAAEIDVRHCNTSPATSECDRPNRANLDRPARSRAQRAMSAACEATDARELHGQRKAGERASQLRDRKASRYN